MTLGALAGWVRGQPSLLIFVAGSTTPSLFYQTMQLSVLNLANCFRWIRFRFWNLRFYRAPELLLASTSYRCWTIFSKLKTTLNEFSLQHFCGSLEPWLCVGRDGAAQAGFQRSPKYFFEKFNQLQLINRPLVAGEDSGDQFAEIVDLLGPPQTDIMEAMGVEDAVRDILLFCISYFYCNGIFSARWRPLPWDWLALADEVQEGTTGHSFWID